MKRMALKEKTFIMEQVDAQEILFSTKQPDIPSQLCTGVIP